jgi:hypothetical protein
MGCTREGHSIDGVLPDDQRRAELHPPPPERTTYMPCKSGGPGSNSAAGRLRSIPVADKALLRAFQWLSTQANFPPRR